MTLNYEVVVTLVDGDARELSRTFESGKFQPPFSVGSQGDWVVSAEGVASVHLWFQFDGQRLYVASAGAEAATYLQNVRIDKTRHEVADRSELRFGEARMKVFWRPADALTSVAPRSRAAARLDRRPSDPVPRVDSPPSRPIERTAALPLPPYLNDRVQAGSDTPPAAQQPEPHRARTRNLANVTPPAVTRAVVASTRFPRLLPWVALAVAVAGLPIVLGFLWLTHVGRHAGVGTTALGASAESSPLALTAARHEESRAAKLPLAPLPALEPSAMALPRAPDSLPSITSGSETPKAYRQDVADKPVPRLGEQPWMISDEWRAHHERQLHAFSRGQAKVIFLGDSITEGWGVAPAYRERFGKYTPLNLGLAGDFTQNVLWRIDHGALTGTNPDVLVLMIGVNNLAGGFSPQQTVAGIRAILAAVQAQLPTTRVLLLAILPARKNPDDSLRQHILDANRLLASVPLPPRVSMHDVGSVLLEPDGTLSKATMGDFLHPTAAGYERLSEAVAPLIDALLAHGAE
jgi:lysophospholipase L1-like esterase